MAITKKRETQIYLAAQKAALKEARELSTPEGT